MSEAPHRGASNEYPKNMFSWRNKKDINIFLMKKAPYLLLCFLGKKFYSDVNRIPLVVLVGCKYFG